jgi:hypothetical protein
MVMEIRKDYRRYRTAVRSAPTGLPKNGNSVAWQLMISRLYQPSVSAASRSSSLGSIGIGNCIHRSATARRPSNRRRREHRANELVTELVTNALQRLGTSRHSLAPNAGIALSPSCAVAQTSEDGAVTVWTHTQGVFPDRNAIAQMLQLPPEKVRCIHTEGSGCYGHNGADDAAADAALIARSYPDAPVRVQWIREQEHGWEPYGPAMVTKVAATVGEDGRIVDWDYAVWSNTHSMRPGGAGALLAGQHMAQPFAPPPPKPLPLPEGGGDRNAIPLYQFPNARVIHHFLPPMPVRVSALRGLGAYMNVFTIESFMDELAAAAAADPVAFRLKHLEDPRAREVITLAAEKFGWSAYQKKRGRGRGFGFARYKNLAAYCAIAAEVEVDWDSGRARLARAVAAVDSGQVVNPDGLKNQVKGLFCNPRAGRFTRVSVSTKLGSPASIGPLTRSCVSRSTGRGRGVHYQPTRSAIPRCWRNGSGSRGRRSGQCGRRCGW